MTDKKHWFGDAKISRWGQAETQRTVENQKEACKKWHHYLGVQSLSRIV